MHSSGVVSQQRKQPVFEPPQSGYIKHYEIIRPLGSGGMGNLLLARDTKLGRLVAIKFLRHTGTQSAPRLLSEAQATARASHENIVVIFEIGTFEEHPYLVLEYLNGRTLRQAILDNAQSQRQPLPRGLSLEIMMAVVRALVAAHQNGVVHLDLKPENIMLLDSGQVKVLDFGVASFVGQEARLRAGTRAYMSPEQWFDEEIDERSDLWAVGIILFELLAGAHPLAPLSIERLATVRDLDKSMPNLADAHPELAGLASIVARCLQKDPAKRFSSAEELRAALEPWIAREKARSLGENDSPFTGLGAFQETDANRFFGRDHDVLAVLGRFGRQTLVAVAGPSGAGKSSFVRAGVVPALRRSGETWQVLVVRPGRTPLAGLADALEGEVSQDELITQPALFGTLLRMRCRQRDSMSRLLVFIDQFEELYTLGANAAERTAFLACLLGAADDPSSPLRVIASIRSDFLDRLSEDRPFLTQLSAGLYLLPPVSQDGLREALTEPVLAAGYAFEDESILDAMLIELEHTKNPLPLLQFSAGAWWEARDKERKLLTRAAYEAIGGVGGALARHADATVASMSVAEQRLCRAIFLRLVTPERTRAIATLRDLVTLGKEPAAVESVIDRLALARLILVDTAANEESAAVELVHESLIARWPMLGRWLDQSVGDAEFFLRLRTAAKQWQVDGETTGLLWRDHAAEDARVFYERYRTESGKPDGELLGALEARYLQAVITLADRTRRQQKWRVATAFAIVCIVAVIVSWLALDARKEARRADDEAARVRNQNTELALQALRGRNATRIMLARKLEKDPTTVISLLREIEPPDLPKDWPELVSMAMIRGVATDVWRTSPDRCGYSAIPSPDGQRIAVTLDDGTTRIVGRDLVEQTILRGHRGMVWTVIWTNDNQRVITSGEDGTARIWRADGLGEPMVLRGHTSMVGSVALSPDGKNLVTGSDDTTARVWDFETGRERFRLAHDTEVESVDWSPDGSLIATASDDGIIRLWNADGRGEPQLLRGHSDVVMAVDFRPDGKQIASASRDRTVRVWNVRDGSELRVFRGHDEKVLNVAWSPDGKRLASAAKDQTARVWDADDVAEPLILSGHTHWVYTAAWSPDNQEILTTSLDGTQRRWNLNNIVNRTVLRGHADTVRGLDFSPDGQRIATGSLDKTVRIWNINGLGEPLVLSGHTQPIETVRWSPNGSRFISLAKDGTARIWPANGQEEPVVISARDSLFLDVEWNRDGERFVTTAKDGWIRLWHHDGHEIAQVQKETSTEYKTITAKFDASGNRILIRDSLDARIYIWNLDTPDKLVVLGEHESPLRWDANWSPDGRQILTITRDGIARIWDTSGQSKPIEIRSPKKLRIGLWSLDGRDLILALEDGTLRRWQNGVLGEFVNAKVFEGANMHLAWNRDGSRILATATDGRLRVYHANGSGAPFVFPGSVYLPRTVMWSPSANRMAVHSEDKLAWIWPDVRPWDGLDDQRLWTSTSYCLSESLRMELFGASEAQARNEVETCRQKLARMRSVEGR